MTREDAILKALEHTGKQETTKEVMRAFVVLSAVKPPSLTWDQEIMFTFLFRWGCASGTLWRIFFPEPVNELWHGTPFEKDPKSIQDVFTLPILLRSLYENYLVAFALVDTRVPIKTRQLRYLAWVRRGHLSQSLQTERINASNERLKSASEEFKRSDEQLSKSSEFVALSDNDQKQLLKTGRIGPWHSLATQASVCKSYHDFLYEVLSGYAHSDFNSFDHVIRGSWTGILKVFRNEYVNISALMLDLTRQHLFKDQIDKNPILEMAMKYGLRWTRDFAKIIPEIRKPDEPQPKPPPGPRSV